MVPRRFFLGVWVVVVVVMASGCGQRELDELRAQVTGLEKELQASRQQLTANNAQLSELQTKLDQQQATVESLTHDLVRVKVERDKLRQELTALKRMKKRR